MGMFDYIICKYPLPTKPPDFCTDANHSYQTKDLICQLATYEITESGELKQVDPDSELVPFDGVIEFYDGNVAAAAYGMSFTPDGEDREWVAYEATFVNGVVQSIVETQREREPALSKAQLSEIDARFEAEDPEPVPTMTEPEVGQRMYLQFAVGKGFSVTLLAKTQRDWTIADDEGEVSTMHPWTLGRLLFHSQEESDRAKAWRDNLTKQKGNYAKQLLRQIKSKTNES